MNLKNNFLNQPELEINDERFISIYKNLQGNILKGHGRDHAIMIFIQFQKKASHISEIKARLSDFAENHVTSFYKQLCERERYKRNRVPGGTFGSVYITSKGYSFLEKEQLHTDAAFLNGMKGRPGLNDPVAGLDKGLNKAIDAMILLADDDTDRMNNTAGDILNDFEKSCKIVHIEYGDAIRNANGDGLEHNGYVDGISQPLFLKDEVDEYIKQQNIKGDNFRFDPRATPGVVLLEDPFAPATDDNYGSYFVFRKLEQHVKSFKENEDAIGNILYGKINEDEKERVGALLVGRFEDGTPIEIQNENNLIGSGIYNNFNYATDPSGGKCPHFAHIRKTNPRTDNKFDEHTMARRGIPFGHRNVNTFLEIKNSQQYPEKGVGLLFMSYQKSILNQFEFIQKAANAKTNGGVDPVIGQSKRGKLSFPKDADTLPGAEMNHLFDQHTIFKGGEYFFAPSITYLKSLKTN